MHSLSLITIVGWVRGLVVYSIGGVVLGVVRVGVTITARTSIAHWSTCWLRNIVWKVSSYGVVTCYGVLRWTWGKARAKGLLLHHTPFWMVFFWWRLWAVGLWFHWNYYELTFSLQLKPLNLPPMPRRYYNWFE